MSDAIFGMQADTALAAGQTAPSFDRKMDVAKARQVAEDFEAYFLSQAFQPMFDTLSTEAPFGGGHAEKMWQSMMVGEYGKTMAKAGGIGIADAVFKQILSMQEVQ